MKVDTPTQTVLYTIEQAIKEYRKFSQKNITGLVKDITVDQCLLLIMLDRNPQLNQNEIAELIFKDKASVTRIIELMVKKGILERAFHQTDRRKFNLKITVKGRHVLKKLSPVILGNREAALRGVSDLEIMALHKTLLKIITNCRLR